MINSLKRVMNGFHRYFLVFAVIFGASAVTRADQISTDLGTVGPNNYGIFFLSTASNPHMNYGTNVDNIGLDGGQLNLDNPGTIVGNLYLSSGSIFQNTSTLTGTIFYNQNLSQPNNDAATAYSTFNSLAATQTVCGTPPCSITGTTTINGTSGAVNVIKLAGINLNNATLTLNGTPGTQFVIDVSGNMNVQSGSTINLTGGLSIDDVVFNVAGSVSTSGAPAGSEVIHGIVLDPTGSIQLSNGFIDGELIAGGSSIQIVSGSYVDQVSTPEPSSILMLGFGLIGLLGLSRAKAAASVFSATLN